MKGGTVVHGTRGWRPHGRQLWFHYNGWGRVWVGFQHPNPAAKTQRDDRDFPTGRLWCRQFFKTWLFNLYVWLLQLTACREDLICTLVTSSPSPYLTVWVTGIPDPLLVDWPNVRLECRIDPAEMRLDCSVRAWNRTPIKTFFCQATQDSLLPLIREMAVKGMQNPTFFMRWGQKAKN